MAGHTLHLRASLLLADSMITPAISVLSAVEGLRVVQPELEPLIIPITVVIIVLLFAVQRTGTARVGRFFGPVLSLPGDMTLAYAAGLRETGFHRLDAARHLRAIG